MGRGGEDGGKWVKDGKWKMKKVRVRVKEMEDEGTEEEGCRNGVKGVEEMV